MSDEVDLSKVAVEFVNYHLDSFYNTGMNVLKGASDKIRLHLNKSYRDYLTCVIGRYSKAKSFFNKNEPANIYDFYVPVGVYNEKVAIEYASISEIIENNPFTVIMGGGGSGKSVLMRHLLLDSIIFKHKVPVLVELRELNNTDKTLVELIQDVLHLNHFALDNDYIEKAMWAGHFTFLIDGFDELDNSLRRKISKQIAELAQRCDENNFIVSSRPSDEFSNWSLFSVFTITPLSLEQACALIEKISFDPDIKRKFTDDLRGGLFDEHQSFLSNPLLLSIMLLTYGLSGDIPAKFSVFYSQAYEALFQRHDALKGGYTRERLSNLDIQDFAKVFAALSIQTYDKRIFQMSKSEALEMLEGSKKISGINFSSAEYLRDAEQAVCLLIEDGLQITFAHRSFQEYFTAEFILHAKPDVQEKLISKYSSTIGRDEVIFLLYEMNPELIERCFIIPYIEELERSIRVKRSVGVTHYTRYLRRLAARVNVREEEVGFDVADTLLFDFHHFINAIYPGTAAAVRSDAPGSEERALYRQEAKSLYEEYISGELDKTIPAKSLTPRHKVVLFLTRHKGEFSKDALERLIELKRTLIKKHQSMAQSLNTIVGDN